MPIICKKSHLPTSPFTVACSGGIDSIAISYLISNVFKKDITLFHFNHKCQPINDEMQSKVEEFAKFLKVKCIIKTRESGEIEKEHGCEADLRKFRLNAYKELNSDIVTCHHLDDATESAVLNFMTTGNMNRCGCNLPIPIKTKLHDSEFSIYRPFMLTNKEDISKFVKSHDLTRFVVEDPTNSDDKSCRRNYVRNKLLPEWMGMKIGIKAIVKKKYLESYK